jgi:hypothetical protein
MEEAREKSCALRNVFIILVSIVILQKGLSLFFETLCICGNLVIIRIPKESGEYGLLEVTDLIKRIFGIVAVSINS